MKMNQTKLMGKLGFYVEESSQYLEAIYEIETAFSIDKSFHAERNLVEELLRLLPLLRESRRQKTWISALNEVQKNGLEGKGGWRKIARGLQNYANPLSGNMTNYRVASFILQQAVDDRYVDIVLALKLLYLEALIRNPVRHKLFTVATSLRTKVISFSFSVKDLTQFSPDHLHDYFNEFESKTDSSIIFISELHSIIDNLLLKIDKEPFSRPKIDNLTSGIPKKVSPGNPSVDKVTSSPVKTLPPNIAGLNTNLRIRSVKLMGEPEASTPDLTSFISLNNEDSDSDIQLEAKINESKYWLRRHQNLVPGDWGMFTPIEKSILTDYIKTNILSGDLEKQKIVGLIALTYLTGRSVEDLLSCVVGDGDVFSKDGIYRREVSRPADAWSPNDIQEQYLEPTASEIELQLPNIVIAWMTKNLGTSKSCLADALELSLAQANEQIRNVLEDVRKNGQFYRIRLERIQSALALETTLMFQDEVVTYQLTSAANHAPPMLSYYVAHDADYLSKCYEHVTAQLVAQWN
jgi:hypothetical protein